MFFVLLLLLASPISFSFKSLALYKQYELPTGANPLVSEQHLHKFAFFQRLPSQLVPVCSEGIRGSCMVLVLPKSPHVRRIMRDSVDLSLDVVLNSMLVFMEVVMGL